MATSLQCQNHEVKFTTSSLRRYYDFVSRLWRTSYVDYSRSYGHDLKRCVKVLKKINSDMKFFKYTSSIFERFIKTKNNKLVSYSQKTCYLLFFKYFQKFLSYKVPLVRRWCNKPLPQKVKYWFLTRKYFVTKLFKVSNKKVERFETSDSPIVYKNY